VIILGLDTTSDQASVALRRDGITVAEEVVTTSDGHSQILFEMIQSTLTKAGIALSDIDCFATAKGPGSFTGVRLCMTAAKGLAEATGKPAAAISSLRALATFGSRPLRNPILDARRGQIYAAVYNSDLELVSEEMLAPAEQFPEVDGVERIAMTVPMAAAIALCAELDGPLKWLDPALLDANYVRRSDAELYWTDAKAQ